MTKLISLLALLATTSAAGLVAAAPTGSSAADTAVVPVAKPSIGLARTRIVPKVNNKTFQPVAPEDTPASFGKQTPQQTAETFVTQKLGFPATDYIVKHVTPLSGGGAAVHFRQTINGLEVHNAAINVNVDKSGKIISYGDTFYRGPRPAAPPVFGASKDGSSSFAKAPAGVKVSPQAAFAALAKTVGIPGDHSQVAVKETTAASPQAVKSFTVSTPAALSPVPGTFSYVQTADKGIRLVYNYQVELENNWFDGHVDAQTGEVVKVVDWVSDASYYVLPFGKVNPNDGPLTTVTTTGDATASPKGWHNDGTTSYTDTRGNNVLAQENKRGGTSTWKTGRRPNGGSNLVFANKPDFTKQPSAYTDAVTQQLFYTVNSLHDLSYAYGFDSASGNFQTNTFGKGGKGNDAVIANAQDGSGTNNANFATPPDGQPGKMRMYVFTETTPGRDGVYDQGIPYHEFTHGISNRLTGGAHDGSCLDTLTAGGMGEGWSDTVAWTILAKPTDTRDTDYVMGEYVVNNPAGIRTYPYSTSLQRNPTLFSYHQKQDYQEVHQIGEIWSGILREVYANLVDKLGFTTDLLHGANSGKGNAVFLRILLDGMKLQPCSPTFISARDAILQAEKNLTGGKYQCDVWKGFAKRGLGTDATWSDASGAKDGFAVPKTCQ